MSNKKTQLTAQARAKAGKGAARAIRREGSVPAVIYGDKKEPVLVTLGTKELTKALEDRAFFTHLCNLDVDGTKHLVIPREVQLDPVYDRPQHVDFLRVTAKTQIKVFVPVTVIHQDEAPGLAKGGILNTVQHEVEVLCPATDVPEEFVVDLTGLEIGDSIHLSDIKLPGNVVPTHTEDMTLITIAAPKAVEEEEPTAEVAEGETPAEGDAEGEKPAEGDAAAAEGEKK